MKTAQTYFAVVREEVKKIAPNQLYLGCRFAWGNDLAISAATKYCDVVSFNIYDYGVEGRRLPDNIDMPIIIGEFHFGALDRGMFHPGLKRAADQQDRADKYTEYVRGAIRNPLYRRDALVSVSGPADNRPRRRRELPDWFCRYRRHSLPGDNRRQPRHRSDNV